MMIYTETTSEQGTDSKEIVQRLQGLPASFQRLVETVTSLSSVQIEVGLLQVGRKINGAFPCLYRCMYENIIGDQVTDDEGFSFQCFFRS